MRFDPVLNDWVGDKTASFDSVVKRSGDKFTDLVKHTYREMLTRRMKGYRVVFTDPVTKTHFDATTTTRCADNASRV